MPRVSIVMSVYNNADTVGKTIESIMQQTFTDWEFVICDDCSKDETLRVIQEYSQIEPRVKILRNETNMGLAYSLNRCIEISTGEYIARQDGDDYSLPERFQKQVDFLDRTPESAFVGSNIILFDERGTWGERMHIEQPRKIDFLDLGGSSKALFCHPSIIFRKDALLKVSCYRVAKETRRGQDMDLYMRLYAVGLKGSNIQENLLYYYEGEKSLKRIPFKHRLNSAVLRYKGYKAMGLLPVGILSILKPVFVGLIPKSILRMYKKRKFG